MTQAYHVSDFQRIFHQYESECKLDNDILSIIQYLEDNIVIPVESEILITPRRVDSLHSERNVRRTNNGGPKRNGLSRVNSRESNIIHSAQEWNDVKNFKSTPIKTSEGIEKEINEIRTMLNKLSAKNYDTMKENIITKVIEFIKMHEDCPDEQKQITGVIFDIACANKIISNLYAELSEQCVLFIDVLPSYLEKYKDSIQNIHYIDSNVDYDGFCAYNKKNDNRKALITFLIHLMNCNLIQVDVILQIIIWLQKITREYIMTDGRINEVDEITENIALMLKMTKEQHSMDVLWETQIQPSVTEFSKMKSKDYKSLSMRTVFKYMDLI